MKSNLPCLLTLVVGVSLQTCAAPHSQVATMSNAVTHTSAVDAIVLRVGAIDDDYVHDPQDPGRVTVGMVSVNANIFDTLTRMDASFQLQPMLAESWEYIEEDDTWRFRLRQSVTFHDGQPFTARAVVETMNRIALSDSFAAILKIDQNSVTAVDDYTVEFKPTTRNLQLPEQLSHPIFGIRAPGSDPFRGEHVGTGPFKFVEYVKDDHITVESDPDYWGTAQQVNRIEFRFIPDPDARVSALQAGEVDIIYSVPLESAQSLSNASHIRVLPSRVGAYQGLSVLLTGEEPYDLTQNILLREAIGYAIDRQAIIDAVFDGFAATSQTLIPASVLGPFADRVKGYTYDPEQAVALLEEADWRDTDGDGIREKDGRALRLELISGYPNALVHRQTPELIQAQLREVGIDLMVSTVPDTPTYEQRLADQRGDLWLEIGNQRTTSPCFLPDIMYFGGDETPNIWQLAFAPGPAGWPAFDDEMNGCNGTSNPAQAALHAANAMHILIDEARAAIPLVGLYNIWFTDDRVQGFTPHPITVMVRWDQVSIIRE
jgi:peptide/nickel transport system substrate-binding protein